VTSKQTDIANSVRRRLPQSPRNDSRTEIQSQKSLATARILDWAGVSASAVAQAKPLAKFDAKLDVRDVEREATLRP
jgi:hypothetical protein